MCGHYTLKAPREAIAKAFDLADVPQPGAQELRWVARPTTPASRGCFRHPAALPGRAHGCLSGGAMG